MANIIQLRRDTEANWISVNPVLADGEISVAKECAALPSTKYKMGDGTTAWNDLDYFNDLSAYVDEAEDAVDAALLYASNAANSAGAASSSATTATSQATAAANSANQAASFVGGNWPLPHGHVTGPLAVDPEYTRLSDAYDDVLRRWEYNQRSWNSGGTYVREATTNMLTAADALSLAGVANVTVTSGQKYTVQCATGSVALSGAGSGTVVPGTPVTVTAGTTTLTLTGTATYVQVENKAYATNWTQGGTTRAAETFAIPVGATQKNLLTLNQATGGDAREDTTGFAVSNGATITRDTTESWNGTGSIKVVTPGSVGFEGTYAISPVLTSGKIYTVSAYAWGSGIIKIQGCGIFSSDYTLSTAKQKILVSFTPTSTAAWEMYVRTNATAQAATFYIDGLQLEEGTTASDWALPEVDYSNAVLNPAQPFSIEFDAVPAVDEKSTDRYVFGFGNSTNYLQLRTLATLGTYYFSHRFNSGTIRAINSGITATTGIKKSFKISVAGTVVQLTVDGVDVGTCLFDGLPSLVGVLIYFGGGFDGSSHRNAQFSNIRIRKGVALTAAERAYTGQLLPDEFTTYYSDCKESISSRPFVRVAGQAQNVVLAGDSLNQNAIINGDFRLASRGTSFTNPANGAFLLDGVTINFNGTGATRLVTQQPVVPGQTELPGAEYYMRIAQSVAPSGQTSQYYIWKRENVAYLSNEKVALILAARSPEQIALPSITVAQSFGTGGSVSVVAQTISNVKLSSKIGQYRFEFTMPSVAGKTIGAGNMIYVALNHPLNSAFTLDIADIELKPADAPDSFYRRDIQMLQQLGARTLQKLPANLQLRAVNIQANYIDFESVVLPVEMRATPALAATYAETTNWKVLNTAAVQTTGFTWALLNASANQVAFRATKTSHGLTDATLQLVTNVLLSAEL